MKHSRRTFIKGMTAAAAVFPVHGLLASDTSGDAPNPFSISLFSKPLDEYGPEFMMETIAKAGIDGPDLTVRPKGIVEPGKVEDDLPAIVELAKKYGLRSTMMVTAINDAHDPLTEKILSTAAPLGIKHYRLGYYDYDYNAGIIPSLDATRKQLEALSGLNRTYGIRAGFQNHSGTRIGAPVWDIWYMIRDLQEDWITCQFDSRHSVQEGAASWIISMQLIAPFIGSLAIKDFTWNVDRGKAKFVNVPLGEGTVDFDLFFRKVKELNIRVPITLHVEYPLLTEEENNLSLMRQQEIMVSRLRKDVGFVRSKLIENGLT